LFDALLKTIVDAVISFQRHTGFPHWVNTHSAAWPAGETLHFIGLCLLIGAVGLFDLRLLGFAKGLPFRALQRLLPWGVLGFVICLATGVGFVLGNAFAPGEYVRNVAFIWKIGLILFAGLNLLVFHASGLARRVEQLGPHDDAPLPARLIGACSLMAWMGVIFFGRFLPVLGDAF
jgi:hypothetical protein